jgi:hypothetical protein
MHENFQKIMLQLPIASLYKHLCAADPQQETQQFPYLKNTLC